MSTLTRRILRSLPRFLARAQSDKPDPVDLYFAYRLLLGRAPDPQGFQHWLGQLDGMSRKKLLSFFFSSSEFQRTHVLRGFTRLDAGDFTIFVDPDDDAASSMLAAKAYEPHVTKALRRELRPDSVFVDIGANIGWFTLLAASLSPEGKVIGIEPNDRNLQLLYRSLAENTFRNVILFPYAATEGRTILQLRYDAAYGFVHAPEKDTDERFVQGVAVDELVAGERRIDVIKMDIEGHEPFALRGMRRTLQRHAPVVFSEFHPKLIREHAGLDPAEYLEALHACGYSLSVLTLDGEEMPQTTASDIMNTWRSVNEQRGTGDTFHLDLIARPLVAA